MAAATARQKAGQKKRHDLSRVDRKELMTKVELDLPLDRAEIAVVLKKSLAWVYEATTDGRLRMNPRIGRMTISQVRADLMRGAGRR